ncbi:LysR substrate-binding domain-containing protein [Ramlibacter albus]|uniref:LysR family transcriptional regulator n=1 Tax=Ramlibacter albus TaxID=2079448 RepID=A0A923MCG6_9BURK|nr:LysR substrate-binding domain-containing protein [Ramlibacter albus]MBC5766854.1 LysR family transcriptional regulator [Ramlibacter albus]
MDFRQVEAFRSVMLTRSMTLSAAALHTSQPNVSRLIARLQAEAGFRLFQRVGLRLVPTPEAEALYVEVQRSFAGLGAIEAAAAAIREQGSGGLRIGASAALSIGVLPAAIRLFRKRRPDVAIKVNTSDSPTVCKWVAAGQCDFGLVSLAPDMPELSIELLHREHGLCIVPAGHRLANKRRVKAADLEGEAFISLGPGDLARAQIDAAFNPDRRRLNLETPYASTICTMVGMGLGVSVVNPMVLRWLQLPDVVSIPFSPKVEFRCYRVRAAHRLEQALAREFMQDVGAVFARGK